MDIQLKRNFLKLEQVGGIVTLTGGQSETRKAVLDNTAIGKLVWACRDMSLDANVRVVSFGNKPRFRFYRQPSRYPTRVDRQANPPIGL